MPYKSSKLKIAGTIYDRRRKLSEKDKHEIKRLYETGEYSQRQLAKLFRVSRRFVVFAIYPERLEENKQRRKERGGWKQYYNKDEHKDYMKNHRRYKKKVHDKLNKGK